MGAWIIVLLALLWPKTGQRRTGGEPDQPTPWPTPNQPPTPYNKPPAPNPVPKTTPALSPVPTGFELYTPAPAGPIGGYGEMRAKQQLAKQDMGTVVTEMGPDNDLAYRAEPHIDSSGKTVKGITVYIRRHPRQAAVTAAPSAPKHEDDSTDQDNPPVYQNPVPGTPYGPPEADDSDVEDSSQ